MKATCQGHAAGLTRLHKNPTSVHTDNAILQPYRCFPPCFSPSLVLFVMPSIFPISYMSFFQRHVIPDDSTHTRKPQQRIPNMGTCYSDPSDTVFMVSMEKSCLTDTSTSLLEGFSPSRMATSQTAQTTHPSSLSLGLQKKGESQLAKRNRWAQSPPGLQA